MINERLRDFPQKSRSAASDRIRSLLLQSPCLAQSERQTIFLFAGLRVEPDLIPLINDTTHRWVFPRVTESPYLEPREIRNVDDLTPRTLGIREPDPERSLLIHPSEISVVLVPGLAFTKTGARLGRGGGYYDRFLSHPKLRAKTIGICFDFQILAELPTEAHDQNVEAVVSESGWHDAV